MNYSHVFWDWNGTLLDDAWLCIEVMNTMLEKYHLSPLTRERYHQVFDFPVRDYYQRLGFDFQQTSFEIVGTEFMTGYHQGWRRCSLHAHAETTLRKFRQNGIAQIILSAADRTLLHDCLAHFELAPLFDEVLGLNHHYADGKLGIAREFMARSNLDPQRALLIGDTRHDFEVAQALGIDCLLFSGGHHPPEKLSSGGAPVIHSLEDLPALFSNH